MSERYAQPTNNDLRNACQRITTRLWRELGQKRITRVDIENIRCAIAGWDSNNHYPTAPDLIAHLEEITLRAIIEKVG